MSSKHVRKLLLYHHHYILSRLRVSPRYRCSLCVRQTSAHAIPVINCVAGSTNTMPYINGVPSPLTYSYFTSTPFLRQTRDAHCSGVWTVRVCFPGIGYSNLGGSQLPKNKGFKSILKTYLRMISFFLTRWTIYVLLTYLGYLLTYLLYLSVLSIFPDMWLKCFCNIRLKFYACLMSVRNYVS